MFCYFDAYLNTTLRLLQCSICKWIKIEEMTIPLLTWRLTDTAHFSSIEAWLILLAVSKQMSACPKCASNNLIQCTKLFFGPSLMYELCLTGAVNNWTRNSQTLWEGDFGSGQDLNPWPPPHDSSSGGGSVSSVSFRSNSSILLLLKRIIRSIYSLHSFRTVKKDPFAASLRSVTYQRIKVPT